MCGTFVLARGLLRLYEGIGVDCCEGGVSSIPYSLVGTDEIESVLICSLLITPSCNLPLLTVKAGGKLAIVVSPICCARGVLRSLMQAQQCGQSAHKVIGGFVSNNYISRIALDGEWKFDSTKS